MQGCQVGKAKQQSSRRADLFHLAQREETKTKRACWQGLSYSVIRGFSVAAIETGTSLS